MPPWLDGVLAANAHVNLDHPDGRSILAEAILGAIPKEVVVASIKSGAAAVLKQRGVSDAAGDLAKEIGHNSSQTVLLMLEVGEL